ncbi:hypothetical protein [Curtobacterium sp. MCSS17_016]|uniref:hypothetical protein n=1 Tax=Curtobacterium sp. MCSS17_016 TaxID=2175644 RepID=UPI000DA83345|nr:hypothetical protein [Curtobacterium sp. MCSS17_016]WIE81251.1 hypothetical protein DEJ19_018630 [Curtobacterium sp. MCSS17_016]
MSTDGSTEPTITGSGFAYDHAFVRVEPFETVSDGGKRMQAFNFVALENDAEQWWYGTGLIIKKDGTVGQQRLTTRILPTTARDELRRILTNRKKATS